MIKVLDRDKKLIEIDYFNFDAGVVDDIIIFFNKNSYVKYYTTERQLEFSHNKKTTLNKVLNYLHDNCIEYNVCYGGNSVFVQLLNIVFNDVVQVDFIKFLVNINKNGVIMKDLNEITETVIHKILKCDFEEKETNNTDYLNFLGKEKLNRNLKHSELIYLNKLIKNSQNNEGISKLQKEYGNLVRKENTFKYNCDNWYKRLHEEVKNILGAD
jgi:uncharacterized protein YihD (DUF1040 family)